MAVTTTTRLGITRWAAGTDPLTEAQMDASHASLEARAAVFLSGIAASRPTADSTNARGLYLSTDTGDLSFSDGLSWTSLNNFGAPVAITPGDTQSAGSGTAIARSNHRHATPSFGISSDIVAVGTTAAAGSSGKFADAAHIHVLGTGSVIAGTIATGGVSASGQIANGIITSSHLAAGAVTASAISADQRMPIGWITGYGGTAAPTGWLFCDGTSYTTAAQPNLFAVIGYTYGGSGSNFNVPDLRTRVPKGATVTGSGLGSTGGADSVVLITANLPVHAHSVTSITVSTAPDHLHLVNGNTGGNTTDHTHTFSGVSGNENQNTSHQHTIGGGSYAFATQDLTHGGSSGLQTVNAGVQVQNISATDGNTVTAHNHNFSGTTAGASATHIHGMNFNSGNGGSHTHTLGGTTDSAGSASALDTRDKFVTLNYIIKI